MKWVLRFPYLNDDNNTGVNTIATFGDTTMNIVGEATGLKGQDFGDMKIRTTDK
jgi:hypothetical protein